MLQARGRTSTAKRWLADATAQCAPAVAAPPCIAGLERTRSSCDCCSLLLSRGASLAHALPVTGVATSQRKLRWRVWLQTPDGLCSPAMLFRAPGCSVQRGGPLGNRCSDAALSELRIPLAVIYKLPRQQLYQLMPICHADPGARFGKIVLVRVLLARLRGDKRKRSRGFVNGEVKRLSVRCGDAEAAWLLHYFEPGVAGFHGLDAGVQLVEQLVRQLVERLR